MTKRFPEREVRAISPLFLGLVCLHPSVRLGDEGEPVTDSEVLPFPGANAEKVG
jgi:hypothetical protein